MGVLGGRTCSCLPCLLGCPVHGVCYPAACRRSADKPLPFKAVTPFALSTATKPSSIGRVFLWGRVTPWCFSSPRPQVLCSIGWWAMIPRPFTATCRATAACGCLTLTASCLALLHDWTWLGWWLPPLPLTTTTF